MNFHHTMATPLTALGLVLTLAVGMGCRPAAAYERPGTTEANITRLTTKVLENSQFAHHRFDTTLAGALLDRYMDVLDGTRSVFLQSDADDFAGYRATLAEATRGPGDTAAAQAIFARYLRRLEQRTAYVTDLLRTTTFDFTGHDSFSFDREHAPRPGDLAAAQALWKQQLRAEYLQEKLGDKNPEQIVGTLTKRYAQQLQTMKSLRSDEVLELYLDALTHVYDPHSDYLGHEGMESLSIAMKLSLFGIGATLESADGYTKIRELVPGGPAARSGLLKAGDRIVAVTQAGKEPVDIVNMPLPRAVELIRGPKGSTVTLTVIPAGAPDGSATKTEAIVRDEVRLADQEAKARIVDMPGKDGALVRLGVIDLPSFYANFDGPGGQAQRSATADVAQLLTKLKSEHVRGVVLDVRHNGGGSLEDAITLAGLFIRQGPVVQTRDQAGDIEVGADKDPAVQYDGPLVLLTSRFSASATEILAGALQDYGRALVVGDPSTFGKGTVQNILPLARLMDKVGLAHDYDPGALKITTNKFYRPSGASTQLRGVSSDIVIPSTTDLPEVSESTLKDPLPWDVVPPKPHESLDRVQPYLAALRERSAQRIATDKAFGYLQADMARLRKSEDTKSVSLNEAERRLELAQGKARRKDEARAMETVSPRTYEITLENLSLPGLPPRHVFPVAAAAHPATVGPDEDDAESSPADDVVLNEGVRILQDYVGLLGG
jgi:carboxyl-terminal processing protease